MAKAKSRTNKNNPKYGSDLVVDLLKAFDIEYVAFNPGATFRGIQDSIVNYGGNVKPKVIFCLHEEIAVALAHGYAKAKGKPMATILHNIVGLQHASMAIYNAWCDRVPILVLGGTGPMDTTRRLPRLDWIHTALVQGNQVRDYVKWDDQPYSIGSIPMSFIRGHRIATTEPKGPVYICYDAGLQEDTIKEPVKIPDISRLSPPDTIQAAREALCQAAKLLVEAKSPLIVAQSLGRNHKSVDALIELADLLAIPVIDNEGGRKSLAFNFPNTHPLDITGGQQEFLKKADVILGLDVPDLYGALVKKNQATRVSDYIISSTTKIIHISMNDMRTPSWAADVQYLQEVDVPICAETSVALPELTRTCRKIMENTPEINKKAKRRFSTIKKKHDQLRTKWLKEAQVTVTRKKIATAFLALELWEVIKKEDWVLTNGSANRWARRLWDWTRPYQYLGDYGGGGVGYGMGASIGAALAHLGSGKICVDIQPDGDLLMTPSALWTAAHYKIPLLIVMYNNQSLYNSQEHGIKIARYRNRTIKNAGIGNRVDNPAVNFAQMAKSYGVHGEGPIRRPADLRPALKKALNMVKNKKLPALVDVICEAR